jgi:predicted site-specific integrase-resolvase
MIAAYSVAEFCQVHRISRAHLYNLIKRGMGPALMKAGKRTLVSEEAATAWRRRMERAVGDLSTQLGDQG